MSPPVTESEKETPSGREVIEKCWGRSKTWVAWFCDPEGPSFGKFIIDMVFKILGGAFSIFGALVLLNTFTFKYLIILDLDIGDLRYVGAALLLFGATMYFVGKHAKRIELKTAAYQADIDALVCDIKQNLNNLENDEQKSAAHAEIDRITFFNKKPSEVSIKRLISLQKMKVDVLDPETIIALAKSSLFDYKFFVAGDENYIRYETIINDLISRKEIKELRPHLKELLDEINEEEFSVGYGEAVLESLSHWSMPAIVSLFVIGVNPMFNPPYFENELTFVHWGVLGMTGAVIYSVNKMRNRDTTKVGEDEGNLELRTMLLGIMLGGISAILLYVSVRSGILGGKALPNLNKEMALNQNQVVINALSIFWGIAAGFSAKLAERLVGSSSSATTA